MNTNTKERPNRLVMIGGAIGLLILLGYGGKKVYKFLNTEETDNAQIDGNIYPVISRAQGYVQALNVEDNQQVKAGQILVQIDPADYQVKVQEARAALKNAQASLKAARQNANIALTRKNKTALDLARAKKLRAQDVVPQQHLDDAIAAADSASAQYKATLAQIDVADAMIETRRAALNNAELQLSYTTIAAPADGRVSKRNVEVGQVVQMGQPLMAVVGNGDIWITANFKETQISEMHVGQKVDFTVDAFPGRRFTGKIDSFAGATGNKFALLPADNATGNFVKVTQRLPVKILIDPVKELKRFRPGMNVIVEVEVD